MSYSNSADILEIKVKDACYRTYYKVRVRVSDVKKIKQILNDLKVGYGIDLTDIKKLEQKFDIFGEPITETGENEPLVW